MKHNLFTYISVVVTLLATTMTTLAQGYHNEGGVKTSKSVDGPDDDGFYTIQLETFATGVTTVNPLDIVLVLDRSGSMNDPYKSTESKTWRASDIRNSDKTLYARREAGSGVNYAYDYYELSTDGNYIYGRNTMPNSSWEYFGTSLTEELYYDLKLPALKEAVNAFIKRIDEKDKLGGSKRIGNRISIVTFSSNWQGGESGAATTLSNWSYLGNASLDLNIQTGYDNLTAAVRGITATGGTYVNMGMQSANTLLSTARSNAIKVVVLFTDGVPGSGKWDDSAVRVANSAISTANTIKGADGSKATVWTVGLFEPMTESEINLTNTYMSRVSSNYLGVSNMTATATAVDDKYYIEVGDDDSLTEIFESVADASATNLGATTQVRDAVSNSFIIPDGTSASDIEVFTSDAKGETTWGELKSFDATINFLDEKGNALNYNEETGKLSGEPKSIVVEGFDFGKADTSVGAGDGHWVGQRYNSTDGYFWAGKKLVIQFKIKANGEATGGTGTPTNDPTSGVYKKNDDGTYTCINHYDIPHTTLTTTIKIKKTGLRIGESATFEIMKIRPKGWDENKTVEENKANIEYNIIGKPLPNSHPADMSEWDEDKDPVGSDLYKLMGWSSFSKVILTNKSETNGAEVIKVLRALDPYWVYMVLEDDWGWAYEMSGNNAVDPTTGETNTSMVELNPFSFHNTEKTGVPKHAEAVTINHFQGTNSTSKEEHYKSSKVESF